MRRPGPRPGPVREPRQRHRGRRSSIARSPTPTPRTTSAPSPDIDIEKSTNGDDADAAPGPQIAVGDPVTWTYVVTNPGNVPIANVAVTDDHAGVDPVLQGGDADGDGLLDPDESWMFQASGTATAGQYENIGTATGTVAGAETPARRAIGDQVSDTDPSHYFGSTVEPPPLTPQADLVVTKKVVGPDEVEVGDKLLFKVTVRNDGPDDAADVVLDDTIDGAVKVLSVKPSQGSCKGKKTIHCELGTIAAGAKATIKIEVRALEPGKIKNVATGSTTTPDPDPGNNRDRATGEAVAARISIRKSVDEAKVRAGDVVTYKIVVRSHSDQRLEDVRVCDKLPGDLLLLSAPGSHPNGVGDPCWKVNLSPHGKRKFTIRAQVGNVSKGEKLRNVAVASASGVRSVSDDARSHGQAPAPEVPPGHCRVTDAPSPAFRC